MLAAQGRAKRVYFFSFECCPLPCPAPFQPDLPCTSFYPKVGLQVEVTGRSVGRFLEEVLFLPLSGLSCGCRTRFPRPPLPLLLDYISVLFGGPEWDASLAVALFYPKRLKQGSH